MPRERRNLRRRRGKCFESGATCADVTANALRAAQPAPMPRQMPRERRNLRRRRGKCRESGATCADVAANAERAAQPAPMPRQMPKERHNLRRCRGKCFESGATCTDAAVNAERAAQSLLLISWRWRITRRGRQIRRESLQVVYWRGPRVRAKKCPRRV